MAPTISVAVIWGFMAPRLVAGAAEVHLMRAGALAALRKRG
jgi:hypothetical protein